MTTDETEEQIIKAAGAFTKHTAFGVLTSGVINF
jgi:hypothetical protein